MGGWVGSSHRFAGPSGNDAFTKALLHFDSSLVDANAGGSAHTWTATNAAVSGSAPKFGAGSLSCTAGYVSTPDHADFALGSSDWTFDLWLNRNGNTGSAGVFGQASSNFTIATSALGMRFSGNQLLTLLSDGTSLVTFTGTTVITDALQHHVALVRSGSSIKLYVGGVLDGSTTFANPINDSTLNLTVGRMGDYTTIGTAYTGFIDEFRLSVGIARWTADFTPPAAAYG